jgi:hexosaminidase
MKNFLILPILMGSLSVLPNDYDNKKMILPQLLIEKASPSPTVCILPKPNKLNLLSGSFTLSNQVKIYVADNSFRKVALQLVNKLKAADGTSLNIINNIPNRQIKNGILFIKTNDESLNTEGYRLTVTNDQMTIIANTAQGSFYALQSLFQLMPNEIFTPNPLKRKMNWHIPAVDIEDKPRFGYRGLHLDVSRHFQPVSFIKRYIDILSMNKMNTFHWHLTDDQGWRIEVKKYPKLTEIGSKRKETLVGHYSSMPPKYDGLPHGGFYTQAQIKEVVAYAQERFITIIPEIEMPGHALAALTAYPELSCDPLKKYDVKTNWGVSDDVFCPTEKTFTFLEDVLTEVMELFPSKLIHIGGDECPKVAWKSSEFCQDLIKKEGLKDEHGLQSYFIMRIEKFLNSKGRSIIGWDEILEGGLAPNATVMSWRGTEGGIAAAKENHNVIMTPGSHCYLDTYQADPDTEPLAIGGFLTLEKVYSYEPIPAGLTDEQGKRILGVQGNVWTEYIKTPSQVEYMAFPRAIALAEVGWSAKNDRDYSDFVARLQVHFKRLDIMKVNVAKRVLDVAMTLKKSTPTPSIAGVATVSLSSLSENGVVQYTTDDTEPKSTSPIYTKPFVLKSTATIKATVFLNGLPLSKSTKQTFYLSDALGMKYSYTAKPNNTYDSGENGLTNGIRGNTKSYAQWVGFNGTDMEVVFDFENPASFRNVSATFLNRPDAWVFLPDYVILSASNDGTEWQDINRSDFAHSRNGERYIQEAKLPFSEFTTPKRYLKVFVKNIGKCPKGHVGEGKAAWLFVDEIIVEKQ